MIRIADDIYVWRVTNKLSQEEAGAIVGVSGKTWRRWEREQCRPTEDHYETLRYVIAQPANEPEEQPGAARP